MASDDPQRWSDGPRRACAAGLAGTAWAIRAARTRRTIRATWARRVVQATWAGRVVRAIRAGRTIQATRTRRTIRATWARRTIRATWARRVVQTLRVVLTHRAGRTIRAAAMTASVIATCLLIACGPCPDRPETPSAADDHAQRAPLRPVPMILAHRGDTLRAPENSLLAIQHAIEDGADGVEIDLRLTGDDHVVVFHDQDTARLTGVPGQVNSTTLATLKQRALLFPAGATGPLQRVPTLEEVLERFGGQTILFLEMKVPGNPVQARRLAERVASAVSARGLETTTFVSSLARPFIAWTARHHPTLRTVYEFLADDELARRPESKPDDLAAVHWIGPALSWLDPDRAAWARPRFSGISTFTALTLAELERARALGVDLVQTDIPRVAVLWREGRLAPDRLRARPGRSLLAQKPRDFVLANDRLPWVKTPVRPGGVYALELEATVPGVQATNSAQGMETAHAVLAAVDEARADGPLTGVDLAVDLVQRLARSRHTVVRDAARDVVRETGRAGSRFRATLVHRVGPATKQLRVVFGIAGISRGFRVTALTLRVLEEPDREQKEPLPE